MNTVSQILAATTLVVASVAFSSAASASTASFDESSALHWFSCVQEISWCENYRLVDDDTSEELLSLLSANEFAEKSWPFFLIGNDPDLQIDAGRILYTTSLNLNATDSWVDYGQGRVSLSEFDLVLNINGEVAGWISDYRITSGQLAYSLPAVPEPETYAMLLAGLGLVGAVARRRRHLTHR
jgi:hypothetical protein